ncbi:hypothetical protein DL96DRAFT_1501694 [Flagelloscypha sp. PMI_526]|nr:hypothetical protein DL96DRAFT_1501694 [Flagelloscypha sp. PMI_526]
MNYAAAARRALAPNKDSRLHHTIVDPLDSTGFTEGPFFEALHPDIFSHIFPHLTGLDLCRMRRVNKALLALTNDYFRRAFTIERILSPFFNEGDIKSFRELQAVTGAIVSGSAAVQFFGRVHYPESDLDVYSEFAGIPLFATLLEQAGYLFVPEEKQRKTFYAEYNALAMDPPDEPHSYDGFEASAILTIFTFARPASSPAAKAKSIQLMATRGPVAGAILLYHSSCVMNIITYHAAYSFFPRFTFHEYASVSTRDEHWGWWDDNVVTNAQIKYEKRGWKFVDSYPDDYLPREIKSGKRRVGDKYCWTIPLPPTSQVDGTQRVDSHQLNSWFVTNKKYRQNVHSMRFSRTINISLRPVAYTYIAWGRHDDDPIFGPGPPWYRDVFAYSELNNTSTESEEVRTYKVQKSLQHFWLPKMARLIP